MPLSSLELQLMGGILLTSSLSGFLGMGGGLILMAWYSALLPVHSAMFLHGFTQLFASLFRSYTYQKEIQWKLCLQYAGGAFLSFLICQIIAFQPNKSLIYCLLGLFSLLGSFSSLSQIFSVTLKGRPLFCGFLVTIAQLIAGAAGGLLDLFFFRTSLSKYETMATKSLTQLFGHSFKLIYYASFLNHFEKLPSLHSPFYPILIISTFLGTKLGQIFLAQTNEDLFQKMNQILLILISSTLLYKGLFS